MAERSTKDNTLWQWGGPARPNAERGGGRRAWGTLPTRHAVPSGTGPDGSRGPWPWEAKFVSRTNRTRPAEFIQSRADDAARRLAPPRRRRPTGASPSGAG